MRVLIVEDDLDLAETLRDALEIDGFRITTVGDGISAIDALAEIEYDVVILDRDLPGISGDAVCRTIVAEAQPVRILMLTAASELHDKVDGLDLGADDYLTKPFAYPELVARLRALARRRSVPSGTVLDHGSARIDFGRRTVHVAGLPVPLTPKEFDVLEALMTAGGVSMTAESLLSSVWDSPYDRTNGAVRVVIHALRKKLAPAVAIAHSPGFGYRIQAP